MATESNETSYVNGFKLFNLDEVFCHQEQNCFLFFESLIGISLYLFFLSYKQCHQAALVTTIETICSNVSPPHCGGAVPVSSPRVWSKWQDKFPEVSHHLVPHNRLRIFLTACSQQLLDLLTSFWIVPYLSLSGALSLAPPLSSLISGPAFGRGSTVGFSRNFSAPPRKRSESTKPPLATVVLLYFFFNILRRTRTQHFEIICAFLYRF